MHDDACIFCKIFRGDVPAREVVRTNDVLVFEDVNPAAPRHVLAIPRRHARDLGTFVSEATPTEVGDLFAVASNAGRAASGSGYRLVVNEGVDAGQTVFPPASSRAGRTRARLAAGLVAGRRPSRCDTFSRLPRAQPR